MAQSRMPVSRADRLSALKLKFSDAQAAGRAPVIEYAIEHLSRISGRRLRRLLQIHDWIIEAAPELLETSVHEYLAYHLHGLPLLHIQFDLIGRPILATHHFWRDLKRAGFPLRRALYFGSPGADFHIVKGLVGRNVTGSNTMALAKAIVVHAQPRRIVIPRDDPDPPELNRYFAVMTQSGYEVAQRVRGCILGSMPGTTEILWEDPYPPGLSYEGPTGHLASLNYALIGGVRLHFVHGTLLKRYSERLKVSLAGPGWLSFSDVDDVDQDEIEELLRHVT